MDSSLWVTIVLLLLILLVVVVVVRAIQVVPQSRALVVERLGKFHSVMYAGLHLLIPFVDRVAARVDLREQVTTFQPQPVITADNVVVSIDSVIYYQVNDPMAATYEIADYITAIEQLTITTLRNVIGSMDLEQTLTSRDEINARLRGVLDEATGKWGIRINRVELKSIDPPPTIQQAMEQQLRADRDKRATILQAEGVRQSQILRAEGEKQSAILQAQGAAEAAVTRADGEAKAIDTVFTAIHEGRPTPDLLSYEYLRVLPNIANGTASKIWVLPTELTAALNAVTEGFSGKTKSE
ncbi:SPFH domain-containing protein [Schaalia sp. JY-X159]|uniref:SPFH domain-containing protein n=1 Tax=Schaalia sp. JY-X159 TaxID=2758575 RepID=UPI00165D8CF7|nr:SPFH domain-containing protein [Schaalia sp. JY-X159]